MDQDCGTTRKWQLFSDLTQEQTSHLHWVLLPDERNHDTFSNIQLWELLIKYTDNIHRRSAHRDHQKLHAGC